MQKYIIFAARLLSIFTKNQTYEKTKVSVVFADVVYCNVRNGSETTFHGYSKRVQGDPIIGASVVEKNASNGSVTDLDGKFSVSTRRDDFETRVKNIGM